MMFSYLTVHFWKCTSRTILNSQNKSEKKKKKLVFFPQLQPLESIFSLQSGFQLLPEGKWVSHHKLDKDPSACLCIKNSVLFPIRLAMAVLAVQQLISHSLWKFAIGFKISCQAGFCQFMKVFVQLYHCDLTTSLKQ